MIIVFLLIQIECQDPNDAFFNQSITVILNGQSKHYYDGNVVVYSSSRAEKNDYFAESSDSLDGTPNLYEDLEPYEFDDTINISDIRVSRVHANANTQPHVLDDISIGNVSNYEVKQYLGDGTFAFVQSAVRVNDSLPVILKQIKPEYLYYSKIEAKILNTLAQANNPNIVKLIDVYFNITSPVLVFEELQNCTTLDYRTYSHYHDLSADEIKVFFYKLFSALSDSHSKGIMHLDIKPANIIVNENDIQLIDWGVSDFYYPLKQYRTRVGTRHYRAPEQLIHYKYYDYAVDVWAMGSIFATAIFKKYPFFNGRHNDDQLVQVVKVLGSQDFFDFCTKYNVSIPPPLFKKLYGYQRQSLERFINDENRELATPEALDLLDKIFVYDHQMRISASEILEHPYFNK